MNSYKLGLLIFVCLAMVTAGSVVSAYQNPIANAGPNLYLVSGQSATLQGSASDPSGYALTYSWSCDGGILSSYNIAQPTYTAPYIFSFNPQAIYTCTLTVTSNAGLSNSDVLKIYVNYGSGVNIVNIDVQTNSPGNIYSNQATLNGSFTATNDSASYAWFQYGFSSNYGTETAHQSMSGTSGSFTQNISSLFLNATYHYRAVVQNSSGNVYYGQDMIFSTIQNYNNGSLSISKKGMDLSSGNLTWQTSINASPSDVLSFAINLQASGQDIHNVIVRDILPANLVYKGSLTVNNSSYVGDITSGVNIGTVYVGQTTVVGYKTQVAAAGNFNFGATTLTNSVTATSTDANTQTSSAAVVVNRSLVYAAETTATTPTSVSTGLTNNFLMDSFFLPLLLIFLGAWLYFTGRIYKFADWLKTKI